MDNSRVFDYVNEHLLLCWMEKEYHNFLIFIGQMNKSTLVSFLFYLEKNTDQLVPVVDFVQEHNSGNPDIIPEADYLAQMENTFPRERAI